jgi:DNA transposition AAA+ family ATPase
MLSHPEQQERDPQPETGNAPKVRAHDKVLRQRLIDLLGCTGWSRNLIAKRLGVSSSQVSQYLNEEGCIYVGDIPKLERSINDLLENETRRRASGVETTQTTITDQLRDALEYIRKTSDIGVVLAESGEGKTRGIEHFVKNNPTAIHYRTFCWSNDLHSVENSMFEMAGRTGYDGKTKRVLCTVRNLRGSQRLIIIDDAHKLTRPALQWWIDFHDATQCPLGLAGTFALLSKLEDDPQRFSRVGLHFEITNKEDGIDRHLLVHLIDTLVPHCLDSDKSELIDLCEQVAKEHGHYRSVHKQLKLAAEIKSSRGKLSILQAFRSAHTMLVRNYNLN